MSSWHWEPTEAGLPHEAVVLTLAADPTDPQRLWAGYYAPAGLAVSRDGGETWAHNAEGLGDNPIFELLYLPGGLLLAATRDGLFESSDGGTSWKPVSESLPQAAAFALAADESGTVYVGFDDAGLYTGKPGSDTWTPMAQERGSELATAAILSLAVSPGGTQIYAGTSGRGLYASEDGGQTWMVAFRKDFVPNLALNPYQPTKAIASLRDRMVHTEDGGESWDPLPVVWAQDEVVSLLWLADSSMKTDHQNSSGMLWAGTGQGQIYYSHDEGNSWTRARDRPSDQGAILALATVGEQPPGGSQRLLAGTWTGIYASEDRGQSWTYISPSLGVPNANTLIASDSGLLLGTRRGLFRWQPTNKRWTRIPVRPLTKTEQRQSTSSLQGKDSPAGGVSTLAVAQSDERVVYAGGTLSGLYRSDDGGLTWSEVPSELEVGIRTLVIGPDSVDHVYLLAAWERMYESNDGGRSWRSRWTGLSTTTETICLAIDPLDSSILYLGTDTGLFRSQYGGEDWRSVGHPLDDQTILTLAAYPDSNGKEAPSVLYIGATQGAYISYDGGDSVERWGRGLEDVSVTAFLFASNGSQIVYAGTAHAGLYRSVNGGKTWQPLGPSESAGGVVEGLAWGPGGELFIVSASGVWVGRAITIRNKMLSPLTALSGL
jgi:photosystem II stability/assembly factor-like uncharacterized protein